MSSSCGAVSLPHSGSGSRRHGNAKRSNNRPQPIGCLFVPEHRDEHDALRSSPVTHAEIEALPLWGRVAFAARCARGAVHALAQKEQQVDERLLRSAVYAIVIAEQLSLGPSKWSGGGFAAVLGGGAADAARAAHAAADDAAKAADAKAAAAARAAAYAAAAAADATKADAADAAAYAAASADAAATAAYTYATFIQQRETYAALKKLMEGLDFTAPVPAVWFLGVPPMAAPASQ
jgi:hypothetical protein